MVVIKPTTTRTHFCQPTLLLFTKTNMANTTFNTFCPSVLRQKGKADLLSSKTNMANTTFNDENIFCLPCNNTTFCPTVPRKKGKADLFSTKTNMTIAREIYYKAVFLPGWSAAICLR